MDALSLGLLAIGLLAAIGAVFVAMSENVTEPAKVDSASPTAQPRSAAPASTPTAAAPDEVLMVLSDGHQPEPLRMSTANDPLHVWLGRQVHLLKADLQKIRQQEDELERRLRLMNGIAVLVQESEQSDTRRAHPRQSRNHRVSSTTAQSGEL
jgi:hypothetical protein